MPLSSSGVARRSRSARRCAQSTCEAGDVSDFALNTVTNAFSYMLHLMIRMRSVHGMHEVYEIDEDSV
jgi:hypothetical protein